MSCWQLAHLHNRGSQAAEAAGQRILHCIHAELASSRAELITQLLTKQLLKLVDSQQFVGYATECFVSTALTSSSKDWAQR